MKKRSDTTSRNLGLFGSRQIDQSRDWVNIDHPTKENAEKGENGEENVEAMVGERED